MIKLLMIADDFTGALDTGIQFAKNGVNTQVFTTCDLDSVVVKPETEVVVVDSETRPLKPYEAYEVVKKIALWGKNNSVEIIFKKTDSALRGNIGAELQALSDIENKSVFFLPEYPSINRITKNGIHYIEGELLENSVFGKDPFEPVKKSYIPDIIKEQSDISVVCLKTDEKIPKTLNEPSILVFDAQTINDLSQRVDDIVETKNLKYIAGCAGLAEQIVNKIKFENSERKHFEKTEKLYIACGSLNDITKKQVGYAIKKGEFYCQNLTLEQKLMPSYYDTENGKYFLNYICENLKSSKKFIVDTFDKNNSSSEKDEFLKKNNLSYADIRTIIPKCHSIIINHILSVEDDITILMTGGDTLMGFMNLVGCNEIQPLCELEQGVVISNINVKGRSLQVISKSGGFGTEDIFLRIANKILK